MHIKLMNSSTLADANDHSPTWWPLPCKTGEWRAAAHPITHTPRVCQSWQHFLDARAHHIWQVLLKKFKKTTGGRLKACLSGGGAISAEVQEWVRTALDCPLVQGFGLTETCAGATIQMPDDMSIGIAGTPVHRSHRRSRQAQLSMWRIWHSAPCWARQSW